METVKGFRDITGEDAEKRKIIKDIISSTFEKYGFEPAETPIIEYEEFVNGENKNDQAVSEIYKLKDKGDRPLALRYEFTFQLKRLSNNKKLPYKRYEIGEVFRDEPTNTRRFRQFTQCDIDIVGSTIKDEAEILAATENILSALNIKNEIYVGNRALLNEVMDVENINYEREQVMREIDKLDKLSEKEVLENLKKFKAQKLIEIFKQPESYFKKYKNYSQFEELKKYCSFYNIKINFKPNLVRGLSYYNGNVWEIKTKEMAETICGGGSYKINNTQSTGIAFGLDRILLIVKDIPIKPKTMILSLDKDKEAINLAKKLREKGERVIIFYGKPSKALEYANSYYINKVIFIGEEEVKKGKVKIKNMKTGKETYSAI